MSNDTQITVKGRAGGPPSYSENGKPFARFRLGTNRSTRNALGEWTEKDTQWFTVKCWNDLAANVATSLKKGTPVLVRGVLEPGTYTNAEGVLVTEQLIHADAVAVELAHGTAIYSKAVREKDESGASTQDGGVANVGDPGWGAGGDVSVTPVPVGASVGGESGDDPPF